MLIRLAPNIWVVSPEDKPRYPYGNCMYIEGDHPTIIDAGAGASAFADIASEQVDLLLLSHFHFDHLHGIDLFPRAALMAGAEEQLTYSDEKVYLDFHGYHLWETLMPTPRPAYGQVVPLPDDVLAKPGFRRLSLADTFNDQSLLDLGSTSVQAIHLPGHTWGHYGFYMEKENILFSGDIDLVPSGPWYSSNSGDVGHLIQSVKKIKDISPAIIVPSHRRVQTEKISAQLDAYIQVVLDRNERLYELLHQPYTLDDLAEYHLIFPQHHNLYELFWEKMTLRNHLRYLTDQGMVQLTADGCYQRI